MPEEPLPLSTNRELTATIVAAYVRQNQIGFDQLGTLMSTVRRSELATQIGLGRGGRTSDADTPTPEPVVAEPTPKRRGRRGQPQ
jgi:predicted transcriptional regulator